MSTSNQFDRAELNIHPAKAEFAQSPNPFAILVTPAGAKHTPIGMIHDLTVFGTRPCRTTLETIPLEIMEIIIGFLNASDLKAIRLCSSRLAHNTRHLLCRNLNVTETMKSFQRMISICRDDDEISRGVKSLTYLPFTLRPLSDEFPPLYEAGDLEEWEEWSGYRVDRGDQIMSVDDYSAILRDRSVMAEKMSNVVFLAQAFHTMSPAEVKNVIPATVLPLHAHFLGLHGTLPRSMVPDYGYYGMPYRPSNCFATRSFMSILLALARSKHSVRTLEVTTGLMFLLSPHIDEFHDAIKGLNKLRITILHNVDENEPERLQLTHNWDSPVEFPLAMLDLSNLSYDSSFGKFISHAKNLESLSITDAGIETARLGPAIGSSPYRLADGVGQLPLQGCSLPNLRFLNLTNMTCTGASLLILFSESKKLSHVELEDMVIKDSDDDWLLWPRFFSSLRIQFKEGRNALTSIKFYGWFDRVSQVYQEGHRGCSWDRVDKHMGGRESDSTCLGNRMEDFIWGKTPKCLWRPVRRRYGGEIEVNATLKVFVDEDLATKAADDVDSRQWFDRFLEEEPEEEMYGHESWNGRHGHPTDNMRDGMQIGD